MVNRLKNTGTDFHNICITLIISLGLGTIDQWLLLQSVLAIHYLILEIIKRDIGGFVDIS